MLFPVFPTLFLKHFINISSSVKLLDSEKFLVDLIAYSKIGRCPYRHFFVACYYVGVDVLPRYFCSFFCWWFPPPDCQVTHCFAQVHRRYPFFFPQLLQPQGIVSLVCTWSGRFLAPRGSAGGNFHHPGPFPDARMLRTPHTFFPFRCMETRVHPKNGMHSLPQRLRTGK